MIRFRGVLGLVVLCLGGAVLPLAAADSKVEIKGAISVPESDEATASASVTAIGGLNKDRKSGTATVNVGDSISISLVLDTPEDVTSKAACAVSASCGTKFLVDGFLQDTLQVEVDNSRLSASIAGKIVENPSDKPNQNQNQNGGNEGGPSGGGPGNNGMSGITIPCTSCSGNPIPGQGTMPILKTSSDFSVGLGISNLGISVGELRFHKDSVADGTVSRSDLSIILVDGSKFVWIH